METKAAAQLWADTWARAWPHRNVDVIASLYADGAQYHSNPFRPPESALDYLRRVILMEDNIECWFGKAIVEGDRAAVQWWGSWAENGEELTYAGVTVLRFDKEGKVTDHRDYDHHLERRIPPFDGW